MTTKRTNETDKTAERSCYVPLWDEATEEFHNGWLTYRPADPYFVHVDIEDWPAPVVVPRHVLADGLTELAECLSKPDRTALRVQPSSDGKYVLLGVTQGDLLLGVFRAPADLLARHLDGLDELVPMGGEMAEIDWDAVIATLLAA
ncbi:SsgA family sporulation/cell division regulator [Nonomuraea sp. NPDC049504]|uniref:SsgA family sporulation/cell division regulator n=1 Tax=Nonomuraea sp. NPDC049504 TaxID=3154729 RepID=UPI00342A925D